MQCHATFHNAVSLKLNPSKSLAWHEDEEHAECRVDQRDVQEGHPRSLREETADEGLADAVEGHEGVFGEADEGKDRVEHELVGDEEVDA